MASESHPSADTPFLRFRRGPVPAALLTQVTGRLYCRRMAEKQATFEVHGLTQGERFQLLTLATSDAVRFVDEPVPEEAAGEIALATALIIGSIVGLKALAQFLLWRHRGESFEETLEITAPDGMKQKRTIKWRKGETKDPEAALVENLTSLPASLDPTSASDGLR